MLQFIIIYFIAQFVNVIFNTIRLIFTVKAPKHTASLFTAVSYGLYTVVLVYTASDFDLWLKVAIAFTTNLIGVYLSMLMLEKFKKDKVWKIEGIVRLNESERTITENTVNCLGLTYSLVNTQKDSYILTAYTNTQKESHKLRIELEQLGYDFKFIVFEQNARL